MKKLTVLLSYILIAGLLAACSNSGNSLENVQSAVVSPEYIKCNFYNEKEFKRSVSDMKPAGPSGIKIKGGIVPHHLLACNLISSFFSSLSDSKPDYVVVIAPNHNGIGKKQIITGSRSWATPFGVLDGDTELSKSLLEDIDTEENYPVLENDHSISGLVPYIKYYIPHSRIIPVMLKGSLSLEDCKNLSQRIQRTMSGKNYVIIASIDFSHYLTLDKAEKMDEITLKAIQDRDFKNIRNMGNDNLDSPPSLITFLETMQQTGADKFNVTAHSNSDKIGGIRTESTTSYFTILFY